MLFTDQISLLTSLFIVPGITITVADYTGNFTVLSIPITITALEYLTYAQALLFERAIEMFNKSVFREYDIRGIVDKDITPEFVDSLGAAFTTGS